MNGVISQRIQDEPAAYKRTFDAGTPFKHVVIENFFNDDFCRKLISAFPRYDPARFLNERGHPGKAHFENIRSLGDCYRQLDDCAQSTGFLKLISDISGIPDLLFDPEYLGGGTHENLDDMELDPHVDFNVHPHSGLHRRLNLLVYLNEEWDPSWGGSLELHTNPWLPSAQNKIKLVNPSINRAVLFEATDRSWHGFRAVNLPPEKKTLTRRSFALYFYTKEPPADVRFIPSDLTVFVDRPLPERFRAGRVLSLEDETLLHRLITRRDHKLEYLYDRSLYWAWRAHERGAKLSALGRPPHLEEP